MEFFESELGLYVGIGFIIVLLTGYFFYKKKTNVDSKKKNPKVKSNVKETVKKNNKKDNNFKSKITVENKNSVTSPPSLNNTPMNAPSSDLFSFDETSPSSNDDFDYSSFLNDAAPVTENETVNENKAPELTFDNETIISPVDSTSESKPVEINSEIDNSFPVNSESVESNEEKEIIETGEQKKVKVQKESRGINLFKKKDKPKKNKTEKPVKEKPVKLKKTKTKRKNNKENNIESNVVRTSLPTAPPNFKSKNETIESTVNENVNKDNISETSNSFENPFKKENTHEKVKSNIEPQPQITPIVDVDSLLNNYSNDMKSPQSENQVNVTADDAPELNSELHNNVKGQETSASFQPINIPQQNNEEQEINESNFIALGILNRDPNELRNRLKEIQNNSRNNTF